MLEERLRERCWWVGISAVCCVRMRRRALVLIGEKVRMYSAGWNKLGPVLHRNAKVFVKSFRTAFSRSKTRGLKKLGSRSNSALFPYCTGFSKVSKGLLVCSHVGTGISTKFESGTVCLCVDTTEIF